MDELSSLARTLLLAFADLGIFLSTNHDRLIRKMLSLDALISDQVLEFIDLCIQAELVAPADAGWLRLSPHEARRLAQSLDGHSPVPEAQASAWAMRLSGPAFA